MDANLPQIHVAHHWVKRFFPIAFILFILAWKRFGGGGEIVTNWDVLGGMMTNGMFWGGGGFGYMHCIALGVYYA